MKHKRPFTMRAKLICMLFGLFVLPLGIFGTALFAIQQNITESFLTASLEESTTQLAAHFSQELQTVCGLGNLHYLDEDLTAFLARPSAQPEALRKVAEKYSAYPGKIHADVSVLTPEGALYSAGGYTGVFDPASAAGPLRSGRGNTAWLSYHDFPQGSVSPDYVYAARPLHDRATWESIGTLILSIRETELRKIYSGYLSESQNAYLLDQRGNVVSFVNNQGVDYRPRGEDCALYYGFFLDDAGDHPQYVSYHTVSANAWTLVVASDPKVLWQPYQTATQTFQTLLVLYFLATVLLAVYFSSRFVQPVRQLCDNIAQVRRGHLDTMVPVTSSDEIGQLSVRYNEMLLRIRELLSDVVKEEESRHSAEMQALQAQINPHFIYNALASIRFLVFSRKNEEAEQALLSLINILRGTLSNPHVLSTVGQELKLLQDYVSLQRISFGRPLTVEFDVDESVRGCRICKLTLQPIVENAFIHGFAAKQEQCRLTIRAKDLGDRAALTVNDNGAGFDTRSARPRKWGGVESPHNGLGLNNVRQRLVLTFGQDCGLEVESAPGEGTTVRVTIPKTEEKGDVLVYDNPDR